MPRSRTSLSLSLSLAPQHALRQRFFTPADARRAHGGVLQGGRGGTPQGRRAHQAGAAIHCFQSRGQEEAQGQHFQAARRSRRVHLRGHRAYGRRHRPPHGRGPKDQVVQGRWDVVGEHQGECPPQWCSARARRALLRARQVRRGGEVAAHRKAAHHDRAGAGRRRQAHYLRRQRTRRRQDSGGGSGGCRPGLARVGGRGGAAGGNRDRGRRRRPGHVAGQAHPVQRLDGTWRHDPGGRPGRTRCL